MTAERRRKHMPEHFGAMPLEADALLNVRKKLAAVLQSLEITERRWPRGGPSTAG